MDELITGLSNHGSLAPARRLPCLQTVLAARDQLHSALQSLRSWYQEAENRASDQSGEESATTHSVVRNKVVSKVVYTLPSGVSKGSTQWVWGWLSRFSTLLQIYAQLTVKYQSWAIIKVNLLIVLRSTLQRFHLLIFLNILRVAKNIRPARCRKTNTVSGHAALLPIFFGHFFFF